MKKATLRLLYMEQFYLIMQKQSNKNQEEGVFGNHRIAVNANLIDSHSDNLMHYAQQNMMKFGAPSIRDKILYAASLICTPSITSNFSVHSVSWMSDSGA